MNTFHESDIKRAASLASKVMNFLRKEIEEEDDKELKAMYREDAKVYERVASFLSNNKVVRAGRAFWKQDTAARDYVFEYLHEVDAEFFFNFIPDPV